MSLKASEQRVSSTEEEVYLRLFRPGFTLPRLRWNALLAEIFSDGRSLGPGYAPPDDAVRTPTQQVTTEEGIL